MRRLNLNRIKAHPMVGFLGRMILSLGIFLLIWYAAAFYVRVVRGADFPLPGAVWAGFCELVSGRELLLDHRLSAHLAASLRRWLLGYGGGVLAGLGLGLMSCRFPLLGRACRPLISLLHLVPGLAWIPIAILLVGINNQTAIFLIMLTALPPVALSLDQGLKTTPEEYLMVSAMCGDGSGRRFFAVSLPAALPQLLTGLRLALGNSWRVVVAAEMVIGSGLGLGYSIIQSRWTLDYTAAFICIGAIVACGLSLELIFFAGLEKLTLRRWGVSR